MESFVVISSLIVDCGFMFLYFFNFALGIINAGLIAPSSAFLKFKINKNYDKQRRIYILLIYLN